MLHICGTEPSQEHTELPMSMGNWIWGQDIRPGVPGNTRHPQSPWQACPGRGRCLPLLTPAASCLKGLGVEESQVLRQVKASSLSGRGQKVWTERDQGLPLVPSFSLAFSMSFDIQEPMVGHGLGTPSFSPSQHHGAGSQEVGKEAGRERGRGHVP
jgi:hypothetical protein